MKCSFVGSPSLSIACLALLVGGCAQTEATPFVDQDIGASTQELSSGEFCGTVFSQEHFVDVGDGVQLHVLERFTGRSLLMHQRQAMLMIPATLTNNDLYDANVPGYNALDRAAREGFFAYSVSYEGYGLSTLPADGSTVTLERSLDQMATVIDWIRGHRFVRQVDILGTSVGSDLAIALGGLQNPGGHQNVGRIVLTATVYLAFSDFVQQYAFTPEFEAFLLSIPDGYVETFPPFYDLVITEVDDDVRAWAYGTFPGVYATGPTLEAFDLPAVEAELGRAPAIVFWGTNDPVSTEQDVYDLEAQYGGPMEVIEMENGGHSSFLEPDRDVFWAETFDFLAQDDHPGFDACGPLE